MAITKTNFTCFDGLCDNIVSKPDELCRQHAEEQREEDQRFFNIVKQRKLEGLPPLKEDYCSICGKNAHLVARIDPTMLACEECC